MRTRTPMRLTFYCSIMIICYCLLVVVLLLSLVTGFHCHPRNGERELARQKQTQTQDFGSARDSTEKQHHQVGPKSGEREPTLPFRALAPGYEPIPFLNDAFDSHNSSTLELARDQAGAAPRDEPPIGLSRKARSQQQQTAAKDALQQHQLANSGSGPKLVQWANKEPVHYFEGSTLVLSCSLAISQPHTLLPLKFTWLKQMKPLITTASGNSNGGPLQSSAGLSGATAPSQRQLNIDTVADYSFLRLADLRASDSGPYTCLVTNSAGQQDSTTAQVIVNVKLHWLPSSGNQMTNLGDASVGADSHSIIHQGVGNTKRSNSTAQQIQFANGNLLEITRPGQSVSFECGAASQPKPRIRWFRLVRKTTPGNNNNNHHYQMNKQPQHSWPHLAVRTPENHEESHHSSLRMMSLDDEASIRSILMQTNDPFSSFPDFQAIELPISATKSANSDEPNLRWRVESISQNNNNNNPVESLESRWRLFTERAEPLLAGVYGCEADSHPSGGSLQLEAPAGQDKLRRLFGLVVNGE